jgi:hypothetical protein
MLNINGSTYCEYQSGFTCGTTLGLGQTLSNVPGVSSTINEANPGGSGLGTATVTFNPGAPGTYNVDLLLFEELLDADGDNEYGTTGGSVAANQPGLSWQIDVPDYDFLGDPNPDATGTIGANTAANTLSGADDVPGPCPACDLTAMALGLSFTLGANQEEILSFTTSSTAPTSGFYLEQINPTDGINTGAPIDLFYTATATTESTIAGPVPEPGSVILLATMAGILLWAFRSRIAAVKAR